MKGSSGSVVPVLGSVGVLAVASSLAAPALAEDLPASGRTTTAASTGTTEVTGKDQFEAPAAKPAEKDVEHVTEAQILGGGLLSTGNSRSMALTGSGTFKMRRDSDEFTAVAAVNYGRAAADPQADTKTTVENYQGKVRYDRFLTSRLAAFLAATGRRDRFQGLNFRLNVDPGFAYYFVQQASQSLWGELGYDFQYDVRRDEAIAATPSLDKTEARHSGRAFAGYSNTLNEAVAFSTGLEYLQAVTKTENYRINWDVGLTSKIGGNFSLATTFALKYDHNPLPGVKDTDTTTAVSLVYQLL